jgi:hypothetical protein
MCGHGGGECILTHLTDQSAALQALLSASRLEPADPARSAPSTIVPPKGRRIETRQGAAMVAPRAAALLGRLVSQLPTGGNRPPSIQLLPCCAAEHAGNIASTVACAASVLLGRTLLLDALANGQTAIAADLHQGPMPDAFTPGLYHCRISNGRSSGLVTGLLTAHSAGAGPFRLIVLNSPGPQIGGVALALAPLCGGSVLVVLAGVTRLATVRAAAAELASVGARLLGTILLNAPTDATPAALT